jgi:hypothetical protein
VEPKNLNGVLVKGFDSTRTDIPEGAFGYCKPKRYFQSVIEYKSDEETRGRTTHRVFLFLLWYPYNLQF